MSNKTTVFSPAGETRTAGKMDHRAFYVRQRTEAYNAHEDTTLEVRRVQREGEAPEAQLSIELSFRKNRSTRTYYGSLVLTVPQIEELLKSLKETVQ